MATSLQYGYRYLHLYYKKTTPTPTLGKDKEKEDPAKQVLDQGQKISETGEKDSTVIVLLGLLTSVLAYLTLRKKQ